ncbi:hypothetical protein M758_3G195700 [Ceratodon purpureus]|nr:hypothetical protein M758_3G195700 [Ceratodon purpureus]
MVVNLMMVIWAGQRLLPFHAAAVSGGAKWGVDRAPLPSMCCASVGPSMRGPGSFILGRKEVSEIIQLLSFVW